MRFVLHLLGFILWLYLLILVLRMVLQWVQVFARNWRPKGAALVVAEVVYTLTDPPLKLIRRVLPPLRLGAMAFDLGFMIVFLVVMFASAVLSRA